MKTFAVLQLSGCAGCEVSLLDADAWLSEYQLAYLPLIMSTHDMPPVDVLLVSGGVRNDEELYKLRQAVPQAGQVVAVGTCAISGGVGSLGDREEVRELFIAQMGRRHVPRLLPKCHPVDAVVTVDLYLPGCPPTPELFMAALNDTSELKTNKIVCLECGRKKVKEIRPTRLAGFQQGEAPPDICLIKQGHLCIGSSTRNGCGAPCPRAGFPCVGCRGPSDKLIEKESSAWFESIEKVFNALTDIPVEEVRAGLRSPQLALFLFQFSDYSGAGRPPRPKEKVL
jgi:F420-non-reducing hydrogenase small subunit